MYQSIFKEATIGKMAVRNRLVVPPMGSLQATEDGAVTPTLINYYKARAKGGYGLIIVEFACVHPAGKAEPYLISIGEDDKLPGLAQLAAAIRDNGAKGVIQLAHAGRQTSSAVTGLQPVSASAIPCPVNMEKPHALTTPEVYDMIDTYIECAARAKQAGFDGVELHAAHGYLLGQFLSRRTNKRMDEFGGNIENRMRIVVDCIRGIKQKCGDDYPVLVRLNSYDRRDYGSGPTDAIIYAKTFEEAGADCIDVSNGVYGAIDHIVPSQEYDPAYNLSTAAAIKDVVNVPVIATGRFTDPAIIDTALALGKADFIATGRQSIADPEFPNKVEQGLLEEIVPCTGCSQRCLGEPSGERDIGKVCTYNPFSNDREDFAIKPAQNAKKVMVVGAGPAGLEAAWVAAKRGHSVTLYESSSEIGGQFKLACIPPYKQDLARVIKHYKFMGDKYGVVYRTGASVTPELMKEEKPDAVILATGGKPLIPAGINEEKVILAEEVLLGNYIPQGPVLVIGGGMVGVETASFLLDYYADVTIVEMLPQIMDGLSATTSIPLGARLASSGVKIHTGAKVLEVGDGLARVEKEGEEIVLSGFNAIVLAAGAVPVNPLEDEARSICAEVYVVGDAKSARTAKEAVFEAACAAIDI